MQSYVIFQLKDYSYKSLYIVLFKNITKYNNMRLCYACFLVISLLQSQPINAGMYMWNNKWIKFCVATCSLFICFCTVATCHRMNETIPIVKMYGETFTLHCPSHPCTETAGSMWNFTKEINGGSQLIHQGRVLSKKVKDVSDTATYCCVPYCADDTEPCCVSIRGMYIHVPLYFSGRKHWWIYHVKQPIRQNIFCQNVFLPKHFWTAIHQSFVSYNNC